MPPLCEWCATQVPTEDVPDALPGDTLCKDCREGEPCRDGIGTVSGKPCAPYHDGCPVVQETPCPTSPS